jgi:hypothetical protein
VPAALELEGGSVLLVAGDPADLATQLTAAPQGLIEVAISGGAAAWVNPRLVAAVRPLRFDEAFAG